MKAEKDAGMAARCRHPHAVAILRRLESHPGIKSLRGRAELIHRILESLARNEFRGFGGADLDLRAGLGVASLAGLAFDHLEGAEPDECDGILLRALVIESSTQSTAP
jgi:hypothetical protein